MKYLPLTLVVNNATHRSWMTIIQQQAESGLTVTDWCIQNNVDRKTFYYRRHKLRTDVLEAAPTIAELEPEKVDPTPEPKQNDFVPQLVINVAGVSIGVAEGTQSSF